MAKRSYHPFVHAGLSLLLLGATALPALAGPPWISVEYPANPHDRQTSGALLLVRTYHHGESSSTPVSGTAEGLVQGKRRSLPLDVVATGRPGVWAVRGAVPREGSWVLSLSLLGSGNERIASALVALNPQHEATIVRVPSDRRDGWTLPRAATGPEVEEMLRVASDAARDRRPLSPVSKSPGTPLLAGIGLLALLPAGLVLRRRGGASR